MSKNRFSDYRRDKAYKSKYKYVYKYVSKKDHSISFRAQPIVKGIGKCGAMSFETERKAALFVDKVLIGKGAEPVNILNRK